MKETNKSLKFKIENMEINLPKMMRELIDFYIDQRLNPRLETFVTRKEYKESNANKLDFMVFNNYVKNKQ